MLKHKRHILNRTQQKQDKQQSQQFQYDPDFKKKCITVPSFYFNGSYLSVSNHFYFVQKAAL